MLIVGLESSPSFGGAGTGRLFSDRLCGFQVFPALLESNRLLQFLKRKLSLSLMTTPRIGESGSRYLKKSVDFLNLKRLNHACKGPIWQKISHGCNVLSLLVYLKVWKKGYSTTPWLTNAGSHFSITNISTISKPKSEQLEVLCKGPKKYRTSLFWLKNCLSVCMFGAESSQVRYAMRT